MKGRPQLNDGEKADMDRELCLNEMTTTVQQLAKDGLQERMVCPLISVSTSGAFLAQIFIRF